MGSRLDIEMEIVMQATKSGNEDAWRAGGRRNWWWWQGGPSRGDSCARGGRSRCVAVGAQAAKWAWAARMAAVQKVFTPLIQHAA